jgi:hypothetical protein
LALLSFLQPDAKRHSTSANATNRNDFFTGRYSLRTAP